MGFLSQLLWGWRPDAACPEHCGRSDGHSMPPYGERLGGGAVRPLCRGAASSESEMRCAVEGPEGNPRARRKMSHPLEGRFATLERGRYCPADSRGMQMGRMLGSF